MRKKRKICFFCCFGPGRAQVGVVVVVAEVVGGVGVLAMPDIEVLVVGAVDYDVADVTDTNGDVDIRNCCICSGCHSFSRSHGCSGCGKKLLCN